MKKILLWFRIIRPQTLFASLCPVLVGLLVGSIVNRWIAMATILCALSLQILSNLINDYYDFVRGADKAGRKGFKRSLAEGEVTPKQIKRAIFVTLSIALILGAVLLGTSCFHQGDFHLLGGLPIVIIGLTSILFAWLYTATRYALSYLGIADIFVFLYYGIIATTGSAYLQTHQFVKSSMYAGAVCGIISMCVLIINNLRDIEDDKVVGKRTFPVRFGKRVGEIGMLVVVLLIPFFAYLAFGWSLPILVIIPALLLVLLTFRSSGAQYNKCLLCAGMINVIYVLLVMLVC